VIPVRHSKNRHSEDRHSEDRATVAAVGTDSDSVAATLAGAPGVVRPAAGARRGQEVAEVVRMLVSGRTRALNGADLVVDGDRLKTV
jgi:putative oxidoreductase